MIPIGNTLTEYGISSYVASSLALLSHFLDLVWILVIVMIITMFLSDIINNLFCCNHGPNCANIAVEMGTSIDAFLMTVSIGASCAFYLQLVTNVTR